ncbi:MAG TPA: LON peptidase substrate-binding domain-containing protein, partial [Saprospiraceae bacterium]|nr:LON peptidase substrate-binding domain-containing protein [Saprospiraceae bacterium]
MFNSRYLLSAEEGEFLSMISVENEGEDASEGTSYPTELPILAAKNIVLFPGIVLPITIGREKSIKAIKVAYEKDRLIGVLTQDDVKIEDPDFSQLHKIGTIAKVIKLLKMPDGTYTAVLQGRRRFHATNLIQEDPYLRAQIELMKYDDVKDELKFKALLSSIRDSAKEIIN